MNKKGQLVRIVNMRFYAGFQYCYFANIRTYVSMSSKQLMCYKSAAYYLLYIRKFSAGVFETTMAGYFLRTKNSPSQLALWVRLYSYYHVYKINILKKNSARDISPLRAEYSYRNAKLLK